MAESNQNNILPLRDRLVLMKARLREGGVRQTELAKELGWPQSKLSQVLSGRLGQKEKITPILEVITETEYPLDEILPGFSTKLTNDLRRIIALLDDGNETAALFYLMNILELTIDYADSSQQKNTQTTL